MHKPRDRTQRLGESVLPKDIAESGRFHRGSKPGPPGPKSDALNHSPPPRAPKRAAGKKRLPQLSKMDQIDYLYIISRKFLDLLRIIFHFPTIFDLNDLNGD